MSVYLCMYTQQIYLHHSLPLTDPCVVFIPINHLWRQSILTFLSLLKMYIISPKVSVMQHAKVFARRHSLLGDIVASRGLNIRCQGTLVKISGTLRQFLNGQKTGSTHKDNYVHKIKASLNSCRWLLDNLFQEACSSTTKVCVPRLCNYISYIQTMCLYPVCVSLNEY